MQDLQSFIDSLGDACIVTDPEGVIVAANGLARDLFRVAQDQLAGSPLSALCRECDARVVEMSLTGSDPTPARFHSAFTRADSTEFVGEASIGRSADGATSLLIVRPTEELTGSQRVPEGTDLTKTLLEGTVDGLVAYTLDGFLVYANEAAISQWGIGFSEMRSRGPFAWSPPDERHLTKERVKRIVEDGSLRFESSGTMENGLPFAIEIHAQLADSPSGPLIVSNVRDVSDRHAAEEMVRYLAYHDTLTGLANRVLLDQELAHAVTMSERHGDIVGLIYLDLDGFKPVNDTFGHVFGDQVLREVANRIAGTVRDTDLVARPGGDEFVVLFPRLSSESDLTAISHQLLDVLQRPIAIDGDCVTVTASIGTAVHRAGETPEELLSRADLAMYAARDRDDCPGRHSVHT